MSKPKSISSAPKDTNCSGILNKPEPIPANALTKAPCSSSSSSLKFLSSSRRSMSKVDPRGMILPF